MPCKCLCFHWSILSIVILPECSPHLESVYNCPQLISPRIGDSSVHLPLLLKLSYISSNNSFPSSGSFIYVFECVMVPVRHCWTSFTFCLISWPVMIILLSQSSGLMENARESKLSLESQGYLHFLGFFAWIEIFIYIAHF